MSQRRAFAIHGLVVVLLIAVIALGLYKASIVWSLPTQTAYQAGKKWGFIFAPFVWTAVAALLAWIGYRIAGKSESVANLVAGLVLALVATTSGIQVVRYWMYAPPPRQQVQAPQSDNREAMRRLAEEMKTTAPGGPASALSQPTNPRPAATRAPTGTVAPRTTAPVTPRPRPNVTAPPATPAPVLEKANPAIKITLDAIAKELDDAGSALVTQAKPLLDALDKPPIHTREAIQKRITELGALRTAAKELGIRMGGLKEEAEKKLKADGVDETQAFSAAVRFSFDADGMQRSMACEELARLCEAGREECEYLRENFAKWTSDPDKLVQSKDHMVRARAGQFRMRVEHGLGQREQMEARLRGK